MDLGHRAPSRCRAVHRAPTQARGHSLRAACNSHRAQLRGAGRGLNAARAHARRLRSPWLSWRPCWPPATTVWKEFGIAPCSASGSLVAAADAARSPLPTCATCAGLARRAIFTSWSTVRPSRPRLRSPRPRTSRFDRAALALQGRLEASGLTEGTIFRRIWKRRVGPALSPAAAGEIVQRRARMAGLEGDFGGHSLRSGFVTEASRPGGSVAGNHATDRAPMGIECCGVLSGGRSKGQPGCTSFGG